MPRRKRTQPNRHGCKNEVSYPSRRCILVPEHGSVPRCRVDYNLGDDGPWATLRIMSLEEKNGNEEEEYRCAIPRYYAIPLILINKRLAFYEAQCYSDGEPRRLPDGSPSVKQRELREYTYLWKLRCKFLQSIFDMNHERRLDENWKCDHVHGYLHRMYKRYGHDAYQRLAYWRDELKEGRVPYSAPDIADMGEHMLTLLSPSLFQFARQIYFCEFFFFSFTHLFLVAIFLQYSKCVSDMENAKKKNY
jgi:hypothetical protein